MLLWILDLILIQTHVLNVSQKDNIRDCLS